ncbi:MAG: hypothetical protein ACI83W_001994, partial [Marinoscillum sp.]
SQHIEVKEEDFKPMLEGALVEALLFITDPAGYLSMEFEMLDVPVISDKITTPILRYFKIYKTELKEFFENNESATLDDFLEATEDLNEEMDVEGVTQAELLKFSKVLPISLQELFEEEFEEDDKGLEDGDLVEEILETDESELSIEEVFEESEPYEDEAEVEISDETEEVDDETEEKEVELEHEDIEDDLDIEETPDEETIEEDLPEDAIDLNDEEEDNEDDGEEVVGGDDSEEEIEETVNEKFAEDSTTINDKFSKKEEDTLATKLENKKVESVMDAISVNHRYMFAKELFEGDREAFVKAIEHIEKCGSFDEAVELLVQNYAKERAWDMNSDEVKELLKVIFRKFR